MLTDEQIAEAKKARPYTTGANVHHEHNDCIRIAYEWLDAQKKIAKPSGQFRPLKHIVEKWGGRYVSQNDVDIAAYLHPNIIGKYPHYNISARLVEPNVARLEGVGEVNSQRSTYSFDPAVYSSKE